jgi:hypothetical protein
MADTIAGATSTTNLGPERRKTDMRQKAPKRARKGKKHARRISKN